MIRSRLSAALVVALAVAVHAPTLGHSFLLDDGVQIFRNRAVTDGASPWRFLVDRETGSSRASYNSRIYRPLRNYAYRLIVLAAGVRPLAFGLVNLALYALSALLVLALLRRLIADERAAAWAAALWAVLPVHVEPVAYYSALGDLLSLALELAALVVALPLLAGSRARWRFFASALLAALSMLAKEMAVTEPALVVLVALMIDARAWRSRTLHGLVALHGAVAVGYVALRTAVVGAMGQEPIGAATVAAGLRDAPWLLVHYALISVAPLGHAASYRVAPAGVAALVAAVAGMVAALLLAWRWRRGVAIGLMWFAVSLLPVLHVVPLWADLADRFALFPTVGLALALAAAVAPMSRRAIVLVAAALIVYGGACLVEERAWRSDSLLWRYAVDRQPSAPLARLNLAAMLMAEGRVDDAASELEAMHALGWTRQDVDVKRAYVLWRAGRDGEAARAIGEALRLDADNGSAHALAGQLALAAGDEGSAARELVEARRLAPLHPSTGLLGYLVLRARGQVPAQDARVDYLRALQALSFDDSSAAIAAARACLAVAPARAQCEDALGQALSLHDPHDGEARTLLDRCIARGGADARACREAKWAAQ